MGSAPELVQPAAPFLRDAGCLAAAQGGKPNPSLLTIQFKAGDKLGLYPPSMALIGGNA